MTMRKKGADLLPIHHPATTPVAYTGLDNPCFVQPVDDPSRIILVANGTPTIITNAASAPITTATSDGIFLRTIDGGTTPVATQGSTNKKVRIRFKTYNLTTAGFVAAQAAVKVYLGRVTGAPDVVSGSFVASKGTGIIVVGAADLSGAATPAIGTIITGTGGANTGICDCEITYTNTDAKYVVLEYGSDQYILSVALA